MIKKETYELMKKLVEAYESGVCIDNSGPYICSYVITIDNKYNPNYGDDKVCKCGHSYYRHFDSYEDMYSIGCKYCGCNHFELSIEEIREEKLNELGL
jgi:hypothetical protein